MPSGVKTSEGQIGRNSALLWPKRGHELQYTEKGMKLLEM